MDNKPNPPPANATTPTGPAKLSESVRAVCERLGSDEYNAERERVERRRRDAERQLRQAEREAFREAFWKVRGKRYRRCTLENFRAPTEDQREVLATIQGYAEQLAANIEAGINLILTGPEGTGKDHLLAALFDPAIDAGFSLKWTSGAMLWSRLRDGITDATTERSLIADYTKPDVLILSDPQSISGALSKYQQDKLYEIVDTRYNHCQAIWVTLNCANKSEADEKIGAQVVGRLRHDAVSVGCSWDSFRQSQDGKSRRMPAGGK